MAAVDALGLLEEIKPHDLTVPYGDRGGVVIEPMLTDQWYVRADVLAKPAVEAVENGSIQFVPKQYENMYFPDARYSGLVYLPSAGSMYPQHADDNGRYAHVGCSEDAMKCVRKTTFELDVAPCVRTKTCWIPRPPRCAPFSTPGWPENTDALRQFHPTSVMVSGFDIIFFWIARMIMMICTSLRMKTASRRFRSIAVYMTGLIRDDEGQKDVSKSRATSLTAGYGGRDLLEELLEKPCR